ncbi:MAG: DUF1449 family protein [Deltaproteobacteria bacterium]|nr:DUF1449 family protein [Deltaproteobacteria bacterium]
MFAFLNQWWNLPFLVLLGLVVVFLAAQLLGIVGHATDGDADADADVDHDADGPDAEHDADHDADGDADDAGAWQGLLVFMGVGRVPFMVVWVSLFFAVGLCGLWFNSMWWEYSQGNFQWWYTAASGAGALLVGLGFTRVMSRIAGRFVDTGGKGASSKVDLCGKAGVVASPQLDHRHGEIRVRDGRGNEILVHGRLQDGEATLGHGAAVVLVDYAADTDLFWVTASPDSGVATRS